MQIETEKPSKARRSDGARIYSINPNDSMTVRVAGPESRTNSLPSTTILDKVVDKEYNPDDAKEESEITGITFPDGGLRAWSVVFGVRSFS